MPSIQEKIVIDFHNRSVKMVINVADFIDHGHVVAYVPSLKLSAYGETKDEAIKMLFEDVFVDFFQNLFELKEKDVSKELSKYNWQRSTLLRKKYYNTAYVDTEGILKNFNLPKETTINQHQMSPNVVVAA